MTLSKRARRGIAILLRRQARNPKSLTYHQPMMTPHEKALKLNAEFDRKAKWGKKQ